MIRFLSAGLALALLLVPATAQQVTTALGGAVFGTGPVDGSGNQPVCLYDAPGGQCLPFLTRNSLSHSVVPGISTPGPAWATPATTIVDYSRSVINGFPLLAEFGSGTVSLIQGEATSIDIPSTSALYQANSVAGYVRSGGSSTAGVGVYGQFTVSGVGAGQANGDALNGVCTNGALQTSTTGFNIRAAACVESDVNILPLVGGAAPTGNVYGFYTAGGSKIQPTGDFIGYYANLPDVTAATKWKNAFKSADGSATNGLFLGSLSYNTGATTTGSQPILFQSYLTGVSRQSNITADPFGNMVFAPYSSAGVVVQNGAGAGIVTTNNSAVVMGRHMEVSTTTGGVAPTIATNACGSTTQGTVAGNDTAMLLTVGTTGVTSCAVTFGETHTVAPKCVFSAANSTAAATGTVAAYVSASSVTGFTITGSALASAAFDVHCL